MNYEAPAPGSRVFKAIFAVTMPWALVLLMGFVLEPLLEKTLPAVLGISGNAVFSGLLVLLYVSTFAILWPRLSLGRSWLSLPKRVPLGKAFLSTALWAFAGYIVALPACIVIAVLMTRGNTYGEAGVFVAIFSLWMPLWWAVPIGAVIAWRRERRYQTMTTPDDPRLQRTADAAR